MILRVENKKNEFNPLLQLGAAEYCKYYYRRHQVIYSVFCFFSVLKLPVHDTL